MGYRGKLAEQDEARRLRAEGRTLADIAVQLRVSKSSVSLWVRDVTVPPRARRGARRRGPNALQRQKEAEVATMWALGRDRVGRLSDRDLLIAGVALYAGEGTKGRSQVQLANTDPRLIALFCRWLRHFFEIDERRLTVRVYLHEGLPLDPAVAFWEEVTGIPRCQFGKPYRATPHHGIRHSKHPFGCASVRYCSAKAYRLIDGMMAQLLDYSPPSVPCREPTGTVDLIPG